MRFLKRGLFLVLSLLFFSFWGPGYVDAAPAESAKQILINRVKNSDINYLDITKGSTGSYNIKIKELSGPLVMFNNELRELNGASFKADFSINPSAKKLGVGLNAAFRENPLAGAVYIEGNRLILTKSLLAMGGLFGNVAGVANVEEIKDFLYYPDPGLGVMWESFSKNDTNAVMQCYRDLLVFIVEAVPDKYFSSSPDAVSFTLDRQGAEEFLLSLLKKIQDERERFASLLARLMNALNPTQDIETLKKMIVTEIEDSVKEGTYPQKSEDLKEFLSVVGIEKLSYHTSRKSTGVGKLEMVTGFSDKEAGLEGRLSFSSTISGSRDNYSGSYSIELAGGDSQYSVSGRWTGVYSGKESLFSQNDTIDFTITDAKGAGSLFKLELQLDAEVEEDKNAAVSIPVLTEYNSTNMKEHAAKYNANPSLIKVFVDNTPLTFDVPPYVKDGRTMVPIRNLAEAMGCEVRWTHPNRIDIVRGDKKISMYVGERKYAANNVEKLLDVPPVTINGRNMVPLRFIAEELGCRVEFDSSTNTVYVYTDGQQAA